MAAFFARAESKLHAGAPPKIHIVKLIKLMYLADRESMRRCGFPISLDDMVSMKHGPVLLRTLNLINGEDGEAGKIWDSWISNRAGHSVALVRKEIKRKDFDRISDADLAVLKSVWKEFGKMNAWQLRDYTHNNCPEWRDPSNESIKLTAINESDIFVSFNIKRREANALAKEIRAQKALEQHFNAQ